MSKNHVMNVPLCLWDVKNNRAVYKIQELMQIDGYVTAAKLKDAYLGIGVKQETLLQKVGKGGLILLI